MHYYDSISSSYPFHRALRKYKRNSFEWVFLATAETQKELDDLEDKYILLYGYYNLKGGGSHGKYSDALKARISSATKGKLHLKARGKLRSDQHRVNLSNALAGRVFTDTWRVNMSDAQKRRMADPKQRVAISNSLLGKPLSEETKRNMSNAKKGCVFSDVHRANLSAARRLYWSNRKAKEMRVTQ